MVKIPSSKLRTGNIISHQGHLFVATKTIEKRYKSRPIQLTVEMKDIQTGRMKIQNFSYNEPVECLNNLKL